MYSTSWCGYCNRARQHFKRNNIPYQEHDIEKSKKAARDYKKLKGRGVPVILIGKRRMNGFRPNVFDKIYYDKSYQLLISRIIYAALHKTLPIEIEPLYNIA